MSQFSTLDSVPLVQTRCLVLANPQRRLGLLQPRACPLRLGLLLAQSCGRFPFQLLDFGWLAG